MWVWREVGWCFCGGRSEKLKGSILSGKGLAMASISCGTDQGEGSGFLIHPNLLLTTHGILPSATAAEAVKVQLNQGRLPARLVPYRFFITSSVLDLTIVGLDAAEPKTKSYRHQLPYLKTCFHPSVELGSTVYLLSYDDKKELAVGEAKVVIATDNLIKLSAKGRAWRPGSAGFDGQGNLALMICDPMKLASSLSAKSSSASSPSSHACNGDTTLLFGIPIPIIIEWLHQHWQGCLDKSSKPELPRNRLLFTGQNCEHSCISFSRRRIFKPADQEDASFPTDAYKQGSSCPANCHGISTPEICESPRITSGSLMKKENASVLLLDINFPPAAPRSAVLPPPLRQLLPEPSDNVNYGSKSKTEDDDDDDCCAEAQSRSISPEVSELINEAGGFSSGEETMYSAETMESRNIPSPPKASKFHPVGRSQSCVNYSRWTSSQRHTRRGTQHSLAPLRKTQSHGAGFTKKCHEYYSPTVSSRMKKRTGSDQPPARPWRPNVVQVSPRWML